ncbi:MAG: hypothetical protein Q4A21_01060 [bacterium]|nr:hypothetical protein [bacterium]
MKNHPINVMPKIHTATIADKEFTNPETNQVVQYSVLELGLKLDGEIQTIAFNLSKKSNMKLLILASENKNWLNEEDSTM